jgi:hypothetical protein
MISKFFIPKAGLSTKYRTIGTNLSFRLFYGKNLGTKVKYVEST